MTRLVRTCRAGFALPVTIILAGVCAVLIAVAYKLVNDGSRTVRAALGQTCCRLAAQTATDVFVDKLHAAFNDAAWRDASGNESPMHMNDVTALYGKFFGGGATAPSVFLTQVAADFNAHEAVALSGSGTNATSWVAQFGRGPDDRQTDIRITLLKAEAEVKTDDGGVNQYAEVTVWMQAKAYVPRTGPDGGNCGATSIIEEKVRFGALGFGHRAGVYADDVYALPARCFESAIAADCPLVFATCAGNSGWTINGEVRTRGFVWCGNEQRATARIHGELHVAALPGAKNLPSGVANGGVWGKTNFSRFKVETGDLLDECVNGDNCYLRFPSPGRRRDLVPPEPGSPAWYGYETSWKTNATSPANGGFNGVFKGGYSVWQQIEDGAEKVVCRTGADAEWFHPPIFPLLKKKTDSQFNGMIRVQNCKAEVRLGRYPSTDGAAAGPMVSFAGVVSGQQQVRSSTTTLEPLYLIGTHQYPITLNGPLYWNGDVIIGGFVSGHGTICSGRNLHIVRDVIMVNPPTWRQDRDYDQKAREVNVKADMVALLARGNIVIGNYLDASSNVHDGVTGFKDKLRIVTAPQTASRQLGGYDWRESVVLPQDSPLGSGPFDGDYFTRLDVYGRHLFEPLAATDHVGNSVTNLCRPVVRIDAMLCSENAVVGVVGPGDFSWAKSDVNSDWKGDAVGRGYGILTDGGLGLRAGNGMKLYNGGERKSPDDYLMRPHVAFTLNGGIVCRDLAIYVDYDQDKLLPGEAESWKPENVKAIVNWDPRYMADSEDANALTRTLRDRSISDLRNRPVQNPLQLPTDATPKPQVLSWREIADGVTEANWE